MQPEVTGSVLFARPSRVFKDDVDNLVTVLNKRKDQVSFSDCFITFTDDDRIKILETTQKTIKEWARFQDSPKQQDFSYQVLCTTRNILAFQFYQITDSALKGKNIRPYLDRLEPRVVKVAEALADKILNSKYYNTPKNVLKFQRNFDTYLLDMALHFGLPERHSKIKRAVDLQTIREIIVRKSQDRANTPSCDLERSMATGNLSIGNLEKTIYAGQKATELLAQKQELKKIVKCLSQICSFEIKIEDDRLFDDASMHISALVKHLSITYPQLCCLFLLTSQYIPTYMGADLQTIFNARTGFSIEGDDNTRIFITSQPDKRIRVEFTVRFVRPEDTCLKVTGKAEVFYNPFNDTFSIPRILSYAAEHKSSHAETQANVISLIRQQKAQYIIDQALNNNRSQDILDLSAKSDESTVASPQKEKHRNSLQLDRAQRISRDNLNALVSPRAAEPSSEHLTSPRMEEAASPRSADPSDDSLRSSRRHSNPYKGGRISITKSRSIVEQLNELAKEPVQPPSSSSSAKPEEPEKEKEEKPFLKRTVSSPLQPDRRTFISKALSRLTKPPSDESDKK